LRSISSSEFSAFLIPAFLSWSKKPDQFQQQNQTADFPLHWKDPVDPGFISAQKRRWIWLQVAQVMKGSLLSGSENEDFAPKLQPFHRDHRD
jgi:hypothetical protein